MIFFAKNCLKNNLKNGKLFFFVNFNFELWLPFLVYCKIFINIFTKLKKKIINSFSEHLHKIKMRNMKDL